MARRHIKSSSRVTKNSIDCRAVLSIADGRDTARWWVRCEMAADGTILLAAYLVGAHNLHKGPGSFSGTEDRQVASLYRELGVFLGMSPGVCRNGVEMHVVHDLSLIHI